MSQAQKDFLALSHGQEWVTFYESFDKLVQDNLSRSSELLRRAMALPEVADREVQQIRTEMEAKLAAEKTRQKEMLSALREDISGSHRQVSMLARSVGTVIGDLERLSSRVNEAIASYDAEPVAPVAAPPVVSNGAVYANGSAPAAPASQAPAPAATYTPPTLLAAQPATVEKPVFAEPEAQTTGLADFKKPSSEDLAVDFSVEEINAAVEEQHALLAAAEQQLDHLETAIDLSALADAEVEPAKAPEAAPAAEQRPRPHWLSVTRTGGKQ